MASSQSYQFDAFISYRRRDATLLAKWVRHRLRNFRLSKQILESLPKHKQELYARKPRIWLDTAYEKPSDDFLTKKVYPALDRSARLIVVSTPSVFLPIRTEGGAEEPNWLVREIDRFIGASETSGNPRPIDVVLGPGGAEDRFPGRLAERSRWDWIELRRFSWCRSWGFSEDLDAGLAKLVAGLYDIPDSALADLRREERRRRNNLLAGIGLVAVLIAIVIAGIAAFAWQQRNEARAEAERTRRQYYVVSLNLAQNALDEGSVAFARQLLDAQRPREGQEDLRDFDWWFLFRRTGLETSQFFQKDVAFTSVSVSTDGTLVAAGGRLWGVERSTGDPSHLVYVWSLKDGKPKYVLKGHEKPISAVMFSPKSSQLVSTDGNKLKIWNTETGQETHTIEIFASSALTFSPDGGTLAVSSGAQIDLFETKTWSPKGKLVTYPEQDTRALAFSPDGKRLASGGRSKKVSIWELASGKLLDTLDEHDGNILSAAWSVDSNVLATGAQDGVVLRKMDTKEVIGTIPLSGGANSLAFAPGGGLLAIGFGDPVNTDTGKTVMIWDVAAATVRGLLKGHPRRVESLAFAPSGEALVSAGEEEKLRVWDVRKAGYISTLKLGPSPVWTTSFSPDGKLIAAGDGDGVIRVWPVERGRPEVKVKAHDNRIVGLSFDATGRTIASVSRDGSVRLWEPASPSGSKLLYKVGKVEKAEQLLTSAKFSPDGKRLAVTSCGGDVLLWKMPDIERQQGFRYQGCLGFLAWSKDSQYFVAGGGDPANEETPTTVVVQRADGSEPARLLSGHSSWPTRAAFSSDGKYLATGSWGGEIILWDWPDGTLKHRISGHTDLVTAIAFSPTGASIVSAGRDKSVRIWDTATGQGRIVLRDSERELFSVAVHPSGRLIAAGDSGGRITIWTADGAPLSFPK